MIILEFFFQCAKVLGQYKGVCKDELVGGQDSNQLYTASRENEITVVTYRRILISCKKNNHGKKYR